MILRIFVLLIGLIGSSAGLMASETGNCTALPARFVLCDDAFAAANRQVASQGVVLEVEDRMLFAMALPPQGTAVQSANEVLDQIRAQDADPEIEYLDRKTIELADREIAIDFSREALADGSEELAAAIVVKVDDRVLVVAFYDESSEQTEMIENALRLAEAIRPLGTDLPHPLPGLSTAADPAQDCRHTEDHAISICGLDGSVWDDRDQLLPRERFRFALDEQWPLGSVDVSFDDSAGHGGDLDFFEKDHRGLSAGAPNFDELLENAPDNASRYRGQQGEVVFELNRFASSAIYIMTLDVVAPDSSVSVSIMAQPSPELFGMSDWTVSMVQDWIDATQNAILTGLRVDGEPLEKLQELAAR